MKTKYLFTALALGALASCTQEDVLTQGSENLVASKERVEVGQVAFTTGVESRFDFGDAERIGWENGEKFGLFLMDEWNTEGNWSEGYYHPEQGGHWAYDDSDESGEKTDANKTYYREQKVWNQMYAIRNYFQTNIPFIFDRAKGAWTNDDAVVEGNYFAVAPSKKQQERDNHLGKLTNRRDVWLYINPVQKLGNQKNAIGKENQLRGGIEENQFFLGYKQVYRDQKLTDGNVLQLPLQMQPIMGMVKLGIQNSDEKPFIVDKLVIRRLDGGAMPTIAYVRPDGRETESQIWAPSFAKPFDVKTVSDDCSTWKEYFYNEATWTRTAARSIVEYSYPRDPKQNGFIPYGMTAEQAEIAYEYTIDFTDENGEGYLLNKEDFFHALFALPHNMNMREYTYTLYGKQKKGFGNDEFQEGIIVPNASDYVTLQGDESDGQFTLPNVNLAAEGMYQTAYIDFDDFRVETATTCQVSSSEELMRYLKMNEDKYAAGTDVWFKVYTLGDVEITSELVQYIKTQNAKPAGQIIIQFVETRNGHLIFGKDLNDKHENAIDVFYYSKAVDIVVEEGAEMTITKPIVFDYTPLEELLEAIRESGSMPNPFIDNDPLNPYYEEDFLNDGVDVIGKIEPAILRTLYGGVKSILNFGTLNINANIEFPAICVPSLINEEGATMNIGGVTICGGVTDRPDLDGNGKNDEEFTNPALPTIVHNDGTLNLSKTTIVGTLENSNITNVKKGQTTIDVIKNNNTCVGCPTGDAILNIEADGIYNNYDLVCPDVQNGNRGVVNVEGGAQYGDATAKIGGENKGTINVAANAYVCVVNDDQLENFGKIKVEGKLAENIKNSGYIYVIDNGEVMVDGIANNVAGIIDVTEANVGSAANAAMDKTNDNYFRYTVADETKSTILNESLRDRISNNNFGKNPIILVWGANSATEYAGDKLTESVERIIVNNNLVITDLNKTYFLGLKNDYTGVDPLMYKKKDASKYSALQINGSLIINNDGQMFSIGGSANVWVSEGALLKVDNNSVVGNNNKVYGDGEVRAFTKDFNWSEASFEQSKLDWMHKK